MNLTIVSFVHPDLLRLGVKSLIESIDQSISQPKVEGDDIAAVVARVRPDILIVDERMLSHSCKESLVRTCLCYNTLIVCFYRNKEIQTSDEMVFIDLELPLPELKVRFESLISEKRTTIGDGGAEELTARERDIIRDVSLGLSSKEIADKNFISPHTVVTHRKNISRKLGIKSISGLTIYAIINKLVSVDDIRDQEHGKNIM